MARGRFHNKSRVENYRLESLPLPCADTFDRLLDFADAEGRVKGDAKLVNKMVWPLRQFSNRRIEQYLNMLWKAKDDETGLGLIERYEVNRKQYIWFPGFKKHQKGLRPEAEAPYYRKENNSDIPPPPLAQTNSRESKIAEMITHYEEKTGRTLVPNDLDKIKDFTMQYPEGWFEKAVDEAIAFEAHSPMRYIESILETWKEKGEPKSGKDRRHNRKVKEPSEFTEPDNL